ncbi:amino acid transporter-like protein [Tricladium varicosporioides]|nr:amino acid transporter-like protein [Hymenoscyphus varicosporioides]
MAVAEGIEVSRFQDGDQSPENKGNTSRDEEDMAYFGKKQQLRRGFGWLSIVGFVCTLLSTWEGMFAVFLYGFQNGGPAGLVYGFLFCFVGTTMTVASLGEMASMMPLSGGQYHWVSLLAPPNSAKFLSYITGWVTIIGWQAGQASASFLGATIIQGLIVLNNPSYVPQRWQGTLIFYAVIAVLLFINTLLAKWLPKIEGLLLVVHILGFFAIIIPLVHLTPHGSSKDVFATFINGGEWSSNGVSFFVGLITSIFSFLGKIGADSACHMAEEIRDASIILPWAMLGSVLVNGVLGFAMLIAILFCLGDIDSALASPTGFPFIEIFAQATKSNAGASVMSCIIMVMVLCAALGCMATASRLLWAFARDGGVPLSRLISRLHEPTTLPIYAILTSTTISLLLALINIGNTAAFNAFMSVSVSAFYFSYIISISLLLFKRLRKDPVKDHLRWGPFSMGPTFGPLINGGALCYTIITFFFSFWPSTAVVTPLNMNWSVLIFGGSVLFSIAFYLAWGRHSFKWPVVDHIRRSH